MDREDTRGAARARARGARNHAPRPVAAPASMRPATPGAPDRDPSRTNVPSSTTRARTRERPRGRGRDARAASPFAPPGHTMSHGVGASGSPPPVRTRPRPRGPHSPARARRRRTPRPILHRRAPLRRGGRRVSLPQQRSAARGRRVQRGRRAPRPGDGLSARRRDGRSHDLLPEGQGAEGLLDRPRGGRRRPRCAGGRAPRPPTRSTSPPKLVGRAPTAVKTRTRRRPASGPRLASVCRRGYRRPGLLRVDGIALRVPAPLASHTTGGRTGSVVPPPATLTIGSPTISRSPRD